MAEAQVVAEQPAASGASPSAVAFCCILIGSLLAVAGVYALAGAGWALVAAAVPFLAFGGILVRGMTRAA